MCEYIASYLDPIGLELDVLKALLRFPPMQLGQLFLPVVVKKLYMQLRLPLQGQGLSILWYMVLGPAPMGQ